MLRIEFNLAVAIYLMLMVIPLLLFWIYYRNPREKSFLLNPRFIWSCSICTYTYITTKDEEFSACPKCGFINKRDRKEV